MNDDDGRLISSLEAQLLGRRRAATGTALDEALGVDPRLRAAHRGAFPIRIREVGVVGSVAVSGLPRAEASTKALAER